MIYRVDATLYFLFEDEATDFFHDCDNALPKAVTINQDLPNEAHSWARQQRCTHDQAETGPCDVIDYAESP